MNAELLDQIGNTSDKILFLYNLSDKRFDYLSKAIEAIWELSRETIIASPEQLLLYIHTDDREILANHIEQVTNGTATKVKFSLVLPDGINKQVKVDAYPIRDDSGNVVSIAGLAEDITQQMQYQDYLIEFAIRKNSALEIVSHDLRGPLSIVEGVVSLLEAEYREKKYEEISTYTRLIHNAYEACINLITDVLSDEHLRSPAIYVRKERFNVIDLVNKTVSSYQVAENIKVNIEVVASLDEIIAELDEIKFSQILNNLISNSVKFTPPGGRITITLTQEGRNFLITHADNGIGIPEKLQADIFVRYNKTSRPGLQGEKTMGIGLSIVRDLVEIQGGTIRFESEENKGTTFYMTFPRLIL
jgi:PAS domain S-box-containing protein